MGDALRDKQFLYVLLDAFQREQTFSGENGRLSTHRTTAYPHLRLPPAAELAPKPVSGEQSNSSIIYGDRLILKFFRRPEQGINPDLEIGIFPNEKSLYSSHTASLLVGSCTGMHRLHWAHRSARYTMSSADYRTVRYSLKSLGAFYGAAAKQLYKGSSENGATLPNFARETIGSYLDKVGLLGRRTAELHLALASEPTDPAFAPELFTPDFQRAQMRSLTSLTSNIFAPLRDNESTATITWP